MTNNKSNQNVYIQSIEASDIYTHMYRGSKLKSKYVGMIPYSLEQIKLLQEGIKTFSVKSSNKTMTDDVINVKFGQNVADWETVKKYTNIKIDKLDEGIAKLKDDKKIKKKVSYIKSLKKWVKTNDKDQGIYPLWTEVNHDILRKVLYARGFTLTDKKGKQVDYVMYKRSASKSRTGEALFIKKSMYNKMIKWSRMGLPFKKDKKIDMPSLMAYEALVGSSLESLIVIDPKKILIVDDVESDFTWRANVVQKDDETGYLKCVTDDNAEISNSLFDGQSLLNSKYFANSDGKSMYQLRNHMFKSAAFSTNLKLYFNDMADKLGKDYDTWQVKNIFGQPVYVKDIDMITTPSSAKFLKFSNVLKGDNKQRQIWEHWQRVVESEGNVWGICQTESKTSKGYNYDGQFVHQTSYQMLNSMDLNRCDLLKMAEFDSEYLDKLKNDDDVYIKHLASTANEINSNQMLIDLYRINKDIAKTKMFKDFRKAEINRFANHIKKGKVRLHGDYAVILGNPMIMLQHSIGEFDINNVDDDKLELKNNEIYTNLFSFGKDLVGLRNPHTSPSNLFYCHNKASDSIDRYFKLSPNVVVTNSYKYPTHDILSGQDYDGDTMVIFDDLTITKTVKDMQDRYPVSINNVQGGEQEYKLNRESMYEIDKKLAKSTLNIGTVVNLAQELLSLYWDGKRNNNLDDDELDSLIKNVEVMTILSEISIDMAKKLYKLDIGSEIKHMQTQVDLRTVKPNFFKTVKRSKTIKDRVKFYDCPMDILTHIIDSLPSADNRDTVELDTLLNKYAKKNINKKQAASIPGDITKMHNKINSINAAKYEHKEERFEDLDNTIKYYEFMISKKKINPDTMYHILIDALDKNKPIVNRLMNVLHTTHKETFLSIFK